MPSIDPQDYGAVLLPTDEAAAVQRISINLGQFTVNGTKTTLAHIFDRRSVIREVWVAADAIPADADGTMLVNVDVRDASENAFDSIVASFDAELLLTAFEALQATIVAETAENQRTVEPGDSIRIQLVNDSAAVETNAAVVVTILYQVLGSLG